MKIVLDCGKKPEHEENTETPHRKDPAGTSNASSLLSSVTDEFFVT